MNRPRRTTAARFPARVALVGPIILACAACGSAAPSTGELKLGEPLVIGDTAVARVSGTDLFRPDAVRPWGTDFLVLDVGNQRVVRVDAQLVFVADYGKAGSGPGELRFPREIAVWFDTAVVADVGNGRAMFFNLQDGSEVRTQVTPVPPAAVAMLSDGSTIVPAREAGHYLLRTHPDGRAEPFGRFPPGVADTTSAGAVTGCGERVHVFDDNAGTVFSYDAAGALVATSTLPRPVYSSMLAHRQKMLHAFRSLHVVAAPLTKDMAAVGCGSVALLFTDEQMLGLLIDTDAGTARPLHLPQREPARSHLKRAKSVAIAGARLVVSTGDEVRAYELRN